MPNRRALRSLAPAPRNVEHGDRRFGEIGELGGAGQRFLAPRDRRGVLRAPARRDPASGSNPASSAAAAPPCALDLLEQRPRRAAKLSRQRFYRA